MSHNLVIELKMPICVLIDPDNPFAVTTLHEASAWEKRKKKKKLTST
jgi:hypothetical protein